MPEEPRWGRGRSASPGNASARRRPCRRRRVGDRPAPTRVGRWRRPSEVATANTGRAVRGAFWSSRDGAVLSQRETSAAGGGPRRAPCVLAQRDGQPPRPLASVEGSGHYGSQFPLTGSRLQPDQGPDVSSETRWTHAQDRRARRCDKAPRFLRLPCCPSPKICAGELLRCNRAARSPQASPRPPRCRGSPLGRLGDPPKWGPPAGPPAASSNWQTKYCRGRAQP